MRTVKGQRTSLGRRLPSFLRRERESNIVNVEVYEMDKGLVWASQTDCRDVQVCKYYISSDL